jgi:hypothetical protein
MHAIRMLEDRAGSPNGHTVYTYKAGEIYTRESDPPVSDALMHGFIATGHALEVDAHGNPIGTPAEARAKKEAHESEVARVTEESEHPLGREHDEKEAAEDGYNSPQDQVRRRRR